MIITKIKTLNELITALEQHRALGRRIVFTNGCFDILHSGHALYLEAAKALGDVLVVGVNSDASIRRLKGESRPIISQDDRLIMLAALGSVDYVTLFEDDTPLELIRAALPDVLVKGGDWTADNIVGSDIVIANGGMVKSLMFKAGMSTSAIIERVKNDRSGGNHG
ncbi:MAG: D-glycero-beta-D-manno-heptose 1-phosphate adenylyltransferase [Candidatus Cloacimonetes bacterium]|nr:D-glycero-beta-D-manno-heptose 1-phosphate adenylyltransferase [Candidatus Cloacimonadota bacterium]